MNMNRENSSFESKTQGGKGIYEGNQGQRIEERRNKREEIMTERKVANAISS
jgi:hypothetical protein